MAFSCLKPFRDLLPRSLPWLLEGVDVTSAAAMASSLPSPPPPLPHSILRDPSPAPKDPSSSPPPCSCCCHSCLENAVLSAPPSSPHPSSGQGFNTTLAERLFLPSPIYITIPSDTLAANNIIFFLLASTSTYSSTFAWDFFVGLSLSTPTRKPHKTEDRVDLFPP